MQITVERSKETFTKDFKGRAEDLLQELNILTEDVLIVRNGKLITEDELLDGNDEIKLLSVISGG